MVEVPLYVLLLARTATPPGRRAALAFFGTALTHPVLWWVWPRLVPGPELGLATGEAMVIAVETLWMARLLPCPPRDALAAAALANAGSYLVGLAAR